MLKIILATYDGYSRNDLLPPLFSDESIRRREKKALSRSHINYMCWTNVCHDSEHRAQHKIPAEYAAS